MHPIFSIKFAEIKWTDVSPQIQFLTMIACRLENLHWYAQSNGDRFEVRFFWKYFITSLFFQYIQYYQYFQYSLAWYTFQLWCFKILPVCQQCDSLPRRLKRADPPRCLFQSQECEDKSDYLLGWKRNMTFGGYHPPNLVNSLFEKKDLKKELPCAMFYIHMSGLPFAFINMHVSWEHF